MVDCCSAPGLVPLDRAMAQLLEMVQVTQQEETVDLEQALGRVLAQDQTSTLDIPPADNSAMDGYALKFANGAQGSSLKMVGKVFAGHPLSQTIQAGECVRIMTGGQVPKGCDAVMMQENATASPSRGRY